MKSLAVYLHIPFCEKRCGYCDFFSCCDTDKAEEYVNKLVGEIKSFDFTGYLVKTIYIGGGTPSLLSPQQIAKILSVLPRADEISIECNPNSVTEEKCKTYKNLGINRLSIGVQSFDNGILKQLGRIHDSLQAINAVKTAGKYFTNISIDLIVGVPDEKKYKIPAAVLKAIKHISVYSLMKDDEAVCEKAIKFKLDGFCQYEVSNFAKKGYECEHNKVYWEGGEYIGFGAGAHSLMNNTRFCNSCDINNWVKINIHERTEDEIRTEKIMLGLRTKKGIPVDLVKDRQNEIEFLIKQKLIKILNGRVAATQKGYELLNAITLKLL